MTNTVDDPGIAQRKQNRQVKAAAETAAGLTIADRLTRRAKAQTVTIPMHDEDGDFSIVMRQPTRKQMDELQRLQAEIQIESTQDSANEQMCAMLGNLAHDASLDCGFWMSGEYSMEDLIDIINAIFESLVERVKAAQSFRKN